jgi:hypothetical protein
VKFTEPATLEALHRLGIGIRELDFRPLLHFRRPGCDDSVTNLLFNKNEARRDKLIKEIINMHQSILNERDVPQREAANVRIERANIERERKTLNDLHHLRELDLQKIVISKFCDLFQQQFHQQAVDRTLSRLSEITQTKEEILKTAMTRSATAALALQTEIPRPEPLPQTEDANYERWLQQRKDQETQRRERSKLQEAHIQANSERAMHLLQEQLNSREQRLHVENDRFDRWRLAHQDKEQKQLDRSRTRLAHQEAVIANSLRGEEERRQSKLIRLEAAERRSKSVIDRTTSENREKLEVARNIASSRAQKAQEERDKLQQKRDERRTRMENQSAEFSKRLQQKHHELLLKNLEKQLDKEDKIEKVRRIPIAKQYVMDVELRKRHEDALTEQHLSFERLKISNQKAVEQSRYFEKREQLLAEIAEIKDPSDLKSLKKIQAILQVSDESMEKLINIAKATVKAYGKPRSS